jgi:hypothetical protein
MFTVDKDGIRQRPQIRIVSDIPDSPDPYSSFPASCSPTH